MSTTSIGFIHSFPLCDQFPRTHKRERFGILVGPLRGLFSLPANLHPLVKPGGLYRQFAIPPHGPVPVRLIFITLEVPIRVFVFLQLGHVTDGAPVTSLDEESDVVSHAHPRQRNVQTLPRHLVQMKQVFGNRQNYSVYGLAL